MDLDTPLLRLSNDDLWTMGDACEGTCVFGGTGSGKSSGTGRAVALALLRSQAGGLVLTAKPDEAAQWQQWAKETGRTESLIIFSPENPYRFNFLNYELNRPGKGAGQIENLVRMLLTVLEAADRKQGGGGSGNEAYWRRTSEQLLRNVLQVLAVAKGQIQLFDVYELIRSAPQSEAELQSEHWQKTSFYFECVKAGHERKSGRKDEHDFELAAKYFFGEFVRIPEKTRGTIVSTLVSTFDLFLRGDLHELFCTSTSIVPELCHNGAVIILDLPVKEYNEMGRLAQVLFKFLFQRATERRDISKNGNVCFLYSDEFQHFISQEDFEFQTTARSSRVCTIYLTQNVPTLLSMLPGETGKQQVESLMGNLQSKFFHANADFQTNEFASNMIAKTWQYKSNFSSSRNEQEGGEVSQNTNSGANESLEYQVLPHEFMKLRKGGPKNDFEVDAFIVQAGRQWNANGKNYLPVTFSQKD